MAGKYKYVWVIAVLSCAAVGCGDSSGPDTNPSGTYTLQRVNDGPLPRTLKQGIEYKLEILIGSLRIHDDSTFVRSTTSREVDGPTSVVETRETEGTWTRQGTEIRFFVDGLPTNIAVIQARDIIVVLDSVKYEYRR
jgi:hypothetical protein